MAQRGDAKAITDLATEFMRKGNSLGKEAAKPLYQAAVELAKKADDYGDALWVLALAYEHGRGVRKNRRKAVEYYKQGAELGHAPSQHSYGCFLLRGDFLDENKPLGIEWVQKSAKQGYNLAEFTLAKLYEFGDGVELDIDKALEWGEKAAAHGDADTQYEVAKMYTYTDDDDKMIDAKRARYWYKQAADHGHELAKLALRTAPMWEGQDIDDDYVGEEDYIAPEGYDEFCAALAAMMSGQNAEDDGDDDE